MKYAKMQSVNPYSFGSSIKSRTFSAGSGFRFGFNGKENFDKYQDYGFRVYYPELGKFLSTDPLNDFFPWNSIYSYSENRPIDGLDLEGLEYVSAVNWTNQNISDYSISFMYSKQAPPSFITLMVPNWKTVIKGSMYCATSTALIYAQANPKVADYLLQNNFQTNRISGQLEFFQRGGKYHSLISSNQFNKAKGGDLIFMQSTTEKGDMSGHVALLANDPLSKGDSRIPKAWKDFVPEGGYILDMLTTNAGGITFNSDGSTVENTFGSAGYIIEQRADKNYYLKYKIIANTVYNEKSGKQSINYDYVDMSKENLKIQGFGRVEESKIDNQKNTKS
jgi:RHS repeat-associated protein